LIGIYPEGTLTRDENLWPMIAKTGAARLAIITRLPVIPVAAWGIGDVLAPYNKIPRIWPRSKITLRAGEPIDMSFWYGKEDDPAALAEATKHIMGELTTMLEDIRGEKRPAQIFDPHTSDLPRTGNFKKKRA
jgi:1-acyl-sn-glycerol-3-phosphate acyltransferase